MNKLYLFLILAILVSSCSQTIKCNKPYILVGKECCLDSNDNSICDTDEPEQKSVEEVEIQSELEEEKISEKVEEETHELEEEMNNSVIELLIKAKTKVNSYSYTYFGPPDEARGIDFTYKSNILKAEYSSTQKDDRLNLYDTVYLNLNTKNATAYCETISRCDNRDLAIKVSYDDHYRIMPFEILDSITFAVEKGNEQIDRKNTIILEFEDNKGKKGTISIWDFWGMPLKVVYTSPESYKIEYREMAVNSVKDEDIIHTT